ncbi:MAG: STAS domain-containing protein [Acidobacteria bacterium]|nr:STAS domain-containing protein [Acidobacteriota bacterium]
MTEPNFSAADTSLQTEKEIRGNALLYHFEGGFSLVNHAVLAQIVQEIKAAPQRKILMDLAGVRFMDSMGVGILVTILKYARANAIDFAVVSNDVVDQILGVARLNQVLHIVRNLEDALGTPAP